MRGGAAGAGGSNKGGDGVASSISGSDITDVTTVGGGYGGSSAPGPQDGGAGGSGGGAGGHINSQGNAGAGTILDCQAIEAKPVAVPALAKVTPEGILTVSPDVPKVKVVPDCGST